MLRKAYLWVLRLFKKPMTYKELHIGLYKVQGMVFDSIEALLKNDEFKGYLKFVSRNSDEGTFEFRIGDRPLLLVATINPHTREVTFNTFKRTLNLNAYPEMKYDVVPLTELDFTSYWSKHIEFKTPKKGKSPFDKLGFEIDVTHTNATEIGEIYIDQVEKVIFT